MCSVIMVTVGADEVKTLKGALAEAKKEAEINKVAIDPGFFYGCWKLKAF